MLAMYFVHDGGSTSDWRLKGHAKQMFWDFVSTWAVMLNKPSDIGYDDEGYDLPPLNVVQGIVETPKRDNGMLFNTTAVSATEYHKELRETYQIRLDRVAEMVNARPTENFIIWIGHDDEGKYLRSLLPDAIEVKGSDSKQFKKDVPAKKTAGKLVVVAGYGWCGKGVAMRAKGLGANVIVTEIDPIKGIEAVFDGFRVMPMIEAAKHGDIFVTVTGCKDVITKEHMAVMKDGVILSNAGHFDVEVNKNHLEELSIVAPYEVRKNIMTYTMADGRKLNLLGEGRLVNLACGDGHPIEVMDLSFAMQFLAMKYVLEHKGELKNELYVLPEELNTEIAALKLQAMGAGIDVLTEEQKAYLEAE